MKKISLLFLTFMLCFSAYGQLGAMIEVNVINYDYRYAFNNHKELRGTLLYADQTEYYSYFTLNPGYNQLFVSLYALQNPNGCCIDLTQGGEMTNGVVYLERMEIVTDRGVIRTTYPYNGEGRHHIIPVIYEEVIEPGYKINMYFKGSNI